MSCNKTPETGNMIYVAGAACPICPEEQACGKTGTIDVETAFDSWPVAMTYVPRQPWETPYDLASGLAAGTIFPSLNLPFQGGGCR
ncbi:MAG: spore coat associated protein CotJA [Bacillota bacterium]|nr:spore coat associated protein CotJA [Bacillota bacterium]